MSSNHHLYELVKSLDKGQLRLLEDSFDGKEKTVLYELYRALLEQQHYNPIELEISLNLSSEKLSYHLHYLYEYILENLREIAALETPVTIAQKYLADIKLLNLNGLYRDSYKRLKKAKKHAVTFELWEQLLLLLKEEYLLGAVLSVKKRMQWAEALSKETNDTLATLQNEEFVQRDYRAIAQIVHTKGSTFSQHRKVKLAKKILDNSTLKDSKFPRTITAKIVRQKALMDYYYILNDNKKRLNHLQQLLEVYEQNPKYLKGYVREYKVQLSNLANTAITLDSDKQFWYAVNKLKGYPAKYDRDRAEELRRYGAKEFYYFLNKGDIDKAQEQATYLRTEFEKYNRYMVDDHLPTIYCNFLATYFLSGDADNSIVMVNKIKDLKTEQRLDAQAYARIIECLVHLEVSNETFALNRVKLCREYLKKNDLSSSYEEMVMGYLRKLIRAKRDKKYAELMQEFKESMQLYKDALPKGANLEAYDELLIWINSQLEGKHISEAYKDLVAG